MVIHNLLDGAALTKFMVDIVPNFVGFHPLGVVLVAMLGLGVAERAGFIHASLRRLLSVTSPKLLTPILIVVAILSHVAVDAGYVLVVPLGAVVFQAAGRHPLAGISAAFAGVSGGFSATFIPSSLDPMLQGLSQAAAQIIDPNVILNPLNNFFFTTVSALLIILLGWWLTDRVIEPRLFRLEIDGDLAKTPRLEQLTMQERRALRLALLSLGIGMLLLLLSAMPAGSPWRASDGRLSAGNAPLMQSIVSLIFILFLVPGLVYGFVAGTFKSSRDVIGSMSLTMQGMSYYIVMAFFAAQFIYAFTQSNLGALLALEGATYLQAMQVPEAVTIIGVILMTALSDLFMGSASAKWALLAPIFVPMLMQVGISPDLTQAAYRIGDSSTNIITPLMPYFPLIVVFCQRYVRSSGIGTVMAMMLPYSLIFLLAWTALLLGYWALDLPLGLGASYRYEG
ncbi:aminobenzoyl-glutamate transport protein [Azomonas macrocytogenes]|uniref:Aminobenzoyl-glutamate transport protein n=1 Tax=Azomonas macrocytogenes TaxID=69962 RepID=A0A839T1S4_AZOMA|nr:aminobenzoyl-glutamate transport protein [Azomonas macrocytogenes]